MILFYHRKQLTAEGRQFSSWFWRGKPLLSLNIMGKLSVWLFFVLFFFFKEAVVIFKIVFQMSKTSIYLFTISPQFLMLFHKSSERFQIFFFLKFQKKISDQSASLSLIIIKTVIMMSVSWLMCELYVTRTKRPIRVSITECDGSSCGN